jgi:hypothetical protein
MILQLYTDCQIKHVRVRTCSRQYIGNFTKRIGPEGPIVIATLSLELVSYANIYTIAIELVNTVLTILSSIISS